LAKSSKLLLLFTLILSQAFALEGVVVVLEAPLFHEPNDNSRVIQWLRKGQTIYLHPSVGKREDYEDLKPTPDEEMNYFEASSDEYRNLYYDKFIEENLYIHKVGSPFVKTLDKQGRDAYIKREHINIYFQDEREFSETTPNPDPTDYRILEPLDENYPFKNESKGYRGFFTFGLGTQTKQSYPYAENVTNQGSTIRRELNFLYSKRTSFDKEDRYYFGTFVSINSFQNEYTLQTRNAKEQWLKVGVGPAVTYDFWRKGNIAFVGLFSFVINILNTNQISQTDPVTGDSEKRTFQKITFSPKAMGYVRFKNWLNDLDLISGFSLATELPHRLKASDSAENPTWWGKNDYGVNTSFDMSAFVGLQLSL
jgi:hypothetical protein